METGTAPRNRLRHIYWIGGGSSAGKSTVAHRLADEYGLRVYDTDAAMPEHARRMSVETAPCLSQFVAMGMDARWVERTPEEMHRTFHWFNGEGFDLLVDDLLGFPTDQPVIAEGFRLLPEHVKPLLAKPRNAVWLLPTPSFRRAVFDRRGGTKWSFIAKTGDPPRALRNLLDRDAMFTGRLAEQTRRLGLPTLTVDSSITENQLVRRVSEAFALDKDRANDGSDTRPV